MNELMHDKLLLLSVIFRIKFSMEILRLYTMVQWNGKKKTTKSGQYSKRKPHVMRDE
jgi:hypothetical protein